MASTKTSAIRDVLIHLTILSILLISLVLAFFYLYLPATTHHGEKVEVPELKGKRLEEVIQLLSDRDLSYEVQDCTYVPKAAPLTVLAQFPQSGAQVKEDRKILLTVTMANPPEVEMPDLLNLSLRNADILLQSVGLQRGDIRYEPAFSANILRQEFQGKPIAKNTKIPKGSRVNLVIGDGIGPSEFEVPNVVGKSREDAELLLRGSGLKIRTRMDYNSTRAEGTVVKQEPSPEGKPTVRRGSTVTIWITPVRTPRVDSVGA